ncbi:MAG: hypothetical protein AAGG46_13165 [Planctomycetota bacterium]
MSDDPDLSDGGLFNGGLVDDCLFNDHGDEPPVDPLASGDRYLLQERYLELTRELLPRAAERGAWRVRNDHCFMRVLLDHACGGCWYDHLDRRLKAYKQLNTTQLRAAVTLGEQMLEQGEPLVEQHNRQSLRWRGKRGSRENGSDSGR